MFWGSSVKASKAEEIVLEGVLIPVGWGPSGEASSVGLMTFDEEEYRIDSGAAREHRLLGYLRRHVRIASIVRDGRVIHVKHVEVFGNEDKDPGLSRSGEGARDEHE